MYSILNFQNWYKSIDKNKLSFNEFNEFAIKMT